MLEQMIDYLIGQFSPELIAEMIVTFFFVFLVIIFLKSDLVRNKPEVEDKNEEKRKKSLEALQKQRDAQKKKLKDRLSAQGRG